MLILFITFSLCGSSYHKQIKELHHYNSGNTEWNKIMNIMIYFIRDFFLLHYVC